MCKKSDFSDADMCVCDSVSEPDSLFKTVDLSSILSAVSSKLQA